MKSERRTVELVASLGLRLFQPQSWVSTSSLSLRVCGLRLRLRPVLDFVFSFRFGINRFRLELHVSLSILGRLAGHRFSFSMLTGPPLAWALHGGCAGYSHSSSFFCLFRRPIAKPTSKEAAMPTVPQPSRRLWVSPPTVISAAM